MPVLEVVVFWGAAILAVTGGIGVIASPAPVYSAVSLIMTLGNLAILYLLLNAQFIAAAQVLIYAGAVMVLFLFVITLLGVREYNLFSEPHPLQRAGAILLGALFLAGVVFFVSKATTGLTGIHGSYSHLVSQKGNVQAFGHELFNNFLLPFEVTPFILVVAMIGAVALGKPRKGGTT